MRLFFLHTTAALPEMDVAGAGNLPCAEIVFMSNEHIHIDSHSCAAVIDAGTRAQVIAIQLHLGIGIKGIAVFCRQRYACGIEVACYCSRRRNAFPNRIDGADTGVGAGEREAPSFNLGTFRVTLSMDVRVSTTGASLTTSLTICWLLKIPTELPFLSRFSCKS